MSNIDGAGGETRNNHGEQEQGNRSESMVKSDAGSRKKKRKSSKKDKQSENQSRASGMRASKVSRKSGTSNVRTKDWLGADSKKENK